MNCEFCKNPFNLTNKLPKILPCCGFTACQECIIHLAGQPQKLDFTCPAKECGKQHQNQNSLITNRSLEKILKEQIGLMCDQHPQNNCEFYCEQDETFICAACVISIHKGHSCLQTDKQQIINYNNKVLEFLKRQQERIRVIVNDIKAYQQNEKTIISQQYMKLIREAQNIISPRLTIQEQNSIKFPPFKQKEQEEEKVPQQPQQNVIKQEFKYDSKLIKQDDYELLKEYLNTQQLKLELLYRGTTHGFTVKEFHSRCDNKGSTLMVALSEHDQLFGGYTSISWKSISEFHKQKKHDPLAFLFQLTKKFKLTQYQNEDKAVDHDQGYGPIFGGGCDLLIGASGYDFDRDNSCWSNIHSIIGSTYSLPLEIQNNQNEAKKYLAGSNGFKLKEIEVFKVIIK